MKNKSIALFSFFLVLVAISSCQKKHNESASHPNTSQLLGKPYKIYSGQTNTIELKEISKNYKMFKTNSGMNSWNSITTQLAILDTPEMNNFYSTFTKDIIGDINKDIPCEVFIFMDKYSGNFDFQSIKGISYISANYNNKNLEGYQHDFYSVSDKNSTLDKNLSTELTVISSRDVQMLLATSLKNTFAESPYILEVKLRNDNLVDLQPDKKLSQTLLYKNYPGGGPSYACGPHPTCNYTNPLAGCAPQPWGTGTPYCYVQGQDCQALSTNDQADDAGLSPLPLANAYDFRDNFLRKYKIGEKYIEYYHTLSYCNYVFDITSASNIKAQLQFAYATFEVANKLQYGTNDAIPITEEYYNASINQISKYKTIVNNDEISVILSDIQADLEQFKGLTKDRILSKIM